MRFLAGLILWLVTAIAQAQHPAAVRVFAPIGHGDAVGSGVLVGVDEEYGYILTANHVIRGIQGPPSVLFPDGTRITGSVLHTNEGWDLAAIKIAKPAVEPIEIADKPPTYGQVIVGAGFGGNGQYREAAGAARILNSAPQWVEFRAAIRPGDSGGPIFNASGQLTGIVWGTIFDANRQSIGPSYGSHTAHIVAFARSCPGGQCWPIYRKPQPKIPTNPPIAKPAPPKQNLQSCPPAFEIRLRDLEIKVAAWKHIPGPAGPAGERGPQGDKGDCPCDTDKIAAAVENKLRLKPIRIKILDEHGKVTFSEEVFLGGEPLMLQLVPRKIR